MCHCNDSYTQNVRNQSHLETVPFSNYVLYLDFSQLSKKKMKRIDQLPYNETYLVITSFAFRISSFVDIIYLIKPISDTLNPITTTT